VQLACANLLFRARKSLPEDRVPEMVSIFDLDSSCIYRALDHKILEIFAKNAARNATARLKERTVSEAGRYVVDGNTFVTISASGRLPAALADAVAYFLVVATNIDDHMIWWTLQGPDPESLERWGAAPCNSAIDGSARWFQVKLPPGLDTSRKPTRPFHTSHSPDAGTCIWVFIPYRTNRNRRILCRHLFRKVRD
jgi:hypothetical protein